MFTGTLRGSVPRFVWPVGPTMLATFVLASTLARPSEAATWPSGRTTPSVEELIAVDATGATDWPYRSEDVLGDGAGTFAPAEQSLDLRTVYAATAARRLWLRAYVSASSAPASSTVVYVFVDADASSMTGGSTQASEIDTGLTSASLARGFEHVIGIRGDGELAGFWAWRGAEAAYVAVRPDASPLLTEAGIDVDPILAGGSTHGYVQASVDFELLGWIDTCGANFDVRSVTAGALDQATAQPAPCKAADTNGDRVPDIAVPPPGCTVDTQCPSAGRCVSGQCVSGSTSPTCTSDATCGGRLCRGGQCLACTPGGSECGTGRTCASDGRCVDAVATAPGENVEGGAFRCAFQPSPRADWPLVGLGVLGLVGPWGSRLARRIGRRRGTDRTTEGN